jgi:hypothetical protein
MNRTKFDGILKWDTGKARSVIQDYVIPTLLQAEVDGQWPKGASRKVRAALNKQAVAARFADANDRDWNLHEENPSGLLVDITSQRYPDLDSELSLGGWYLMHAMMFGHFASAAECLNLAPKLEPFCVNDEERVALDTAKGWAKDFQDVDQLVRMLDARRPKPVIVCKTLSPLQLENVGKAMQVDLSNVIPCPMKYEYETRTDKKGETYQICVPVLLWPEGTKHGTSKFCTSKAGNSQCEACGHAIRNWSNWVPLVGITPTGPVSLWVGRDCAKSLFECELDGEAEYKR